MVLVDDSRQQQEGGTVVLDIPRKVSPISKKELMKRLKYIQSLNQPTVPIPKTIPKLQLPKRRIVTRNIIPTRIQKQRKIKNPLNGFKPYSQDKINIIRLPAVKDYKW